MLTHNPVLCCLSNWLWKCIIFDSVALDVKLLICFVIQSTSLGLWMCLPSPVIGGPSDEALFLLLRPGAAYQRGRNVSPLRTRRCSAETAGEQPQSESEPESWSEPESSWRLQPSGVPCGAIYGGRRSLVLARGQLCSLSCICWVLLGCCGIHVAEALALLTERVLTVDARPFKTIVGGDPTMRERQPNYVL